jgi:hypothetical protein
MAGLRMAKASQEDIDELKKYLLKAEKRNTKDFPFGWRRVVWGCEILIENCCDPNLDYLALRPELLNSEQNVQVCDATKDDSSNDA